MNIESTLNVYLCHLNSLYVVLTLLLYSGWTEGAEDQLPEHVGADHAGRALGQEWT